MVQRSRDVLREVVKKQDEEIVQVLSNMGGGDLANGLYVTFQGMEDALVPEKAQDAVICWKLTHGADVYEFFVTIKDKKATVDRGDCTDARVTLTMSISDYLRVIVGQLDGTDAIAAGTLKIEGDVPFSQQISEMFAIA